MSERNPSMTSPTIDSVDSHDDPLVDCLVQLGKIHGLAVSKTGLRAGLPLVDNRMTVELFSRAADRAGMASRLVKRQLKEMTNLELPAVLVLDEHKACIALAVDPNSKQMRVLLPESGMGEERIPMQDLNTYYSGYTLFVRPKFKPDIHKSVLPEKKAKNWFWSALFANWRIYRDVLLASLLINIFGLAGPFFTLNVYDRVIPNMALETLWVLALGIGIVYGFNLLMRGLRGYFIDEAGKKANLQVSATIFEKVLGLRMEVRPKSVGAFAKNLQQFETIRDFITSFSITALVDLPFMGLGLVVIWYLGHSIVFIHLAAIVLLGCYALLIQIPLKRAIEKSFQASAQKNSLLVEGLAGVETIKLLGAESQLQRAWEESVRYIAKWEARSRLFSSSVSHFSDFILNIAVVGVIIAAVYRIGAGDLSQGGLIALVILTRQALNPMSQVVNLTTRFHRARAALKTLNTIMALPVERPPGKNFLQRSTCQGRLEFKNIDFSYPGQSNKALSHISFTINPGEKIALIGPIGSGKTTLGKLLLGLYTPSSGLVSLDDTDIRQIDPAELRRFIGYVPQDITLFHGNMRDNIILGSPGIDDNAVLRAAELSGVASFVHKHPKGYDMEIGEQGRGISGGQKQSVAIARAILHDPPIMVLDEPSSAMDNRTETRLKERLKSILPDKTLVLITHRGSLLELVDRIIVIDEGVVVADGQRQQVLNALKSGQISF